MALRDLGFQIGGDIERGLERMDSLGDWEAGQIRAPLFTHVQLGEPTTQSNQVLNCPPLSRSRLTLYWSPRTCQFASGF
jgi:hypothetical protein